MSYNSVAIESIEKPLQKFKEFNNHFFEMVSKSKVMKGDNNDDESSGEVLRDSK